MEIPPETMSRVTAWRKVPQEARHRMPPSAPSTARRSALANPLALVPPAPVPVIGRSRTPSVNGAGAQASARARRPPNIDPGEHGWFDKLSPDGAGSYKGSKAVPVEEAAPPANPRYFIAL
jgi:hypothetical protein